VSETLIKYWEQLLPPTGSEKAWFSFDQNRRSQTFSSKDLMAQAHCVAAYLLQRDIQPGQRVAVVSSASPFYFLIDLALQFVGAVNISVPEQIDGVALETIIREEKVNLVFVEHLKTYQSLHELRGVKQILAEIVLGTDEVENLDLDKLVTFDRVIPLGKEMWRENHDLLKQRKLSIEPQMLCTLLYEPGQKLQRMDFRKLMEKSEECYAELQKARPSLCLNWTEPSRLLTRTYGYFAMMRYAVPLVCLADPEPLPLALARIKPAALTISPTQLGLLFSEIEKGQQNKGTSPAKKFDRMMKLLEKRESLLQQAGKVPFFLRFRYRSLQRGVLKNFRKQLGGKIQVLYVDKGELPAPAERFFRNLGCTIVRP
jgi:long-chain acyl-CoA synthetase